MPKPDPISALAASDIPQLGSVAQLLDAIPLPEPPRFTIRATLLRATAGTDAPRLRYWLDGAGTPLLATVSATTDELAVQRLAAEVFAHISQVVTGAFPPWARWTSPVAVVAYFTGLEKLKAGDAPAARRLFETADRIETANTLPRLQLATLAEIRAGEGSGDARVLAGALRRYRDVTVRRPNLVEPRYRASVVAAMLVPDVDDDNYEEIARRAGYDPEEIRSASDLRDELNGEARTQARKTRRLLWLPYVLVTDLRLRNRYELRGDARRQLRQTMRLSAQCRALRRNRDRAWRRRARAVMVRTWWLGVRRPFCGWQAYYNAGCFYSLLYDFTRSDADARRARLYLTEASERGGRQLNAKWMARRDPDLEPLRRAMISGEVPWPEFMMRLRGSALRPASSALQPSWV